MRKKIMIVLCFLYFIFPQILFAQLISTNINNKEFFNSTEILRLGSDNYFVKILQQYLNKDLDTQVAISGIGSLGQETNYFGLKTESAVKNFQQKYANDILIPAGLTTPSGIVGMNTKNKIFDLYESSSTKILEEKNTESSTKIINDSEEKSIFGISRKEVTLIKEIFSNAVNSISNMIFTESIDLASASFDTLNNAFSVVAVYNSSQFQVSPGATTTINGSGFRKLENDFYIGNTKISNVSCQSSIACDIKIPSSVSEGKKEIILENSGGTTKNQKYKPHIMITKNPKPASVLKEVVPESITIEEIDKEIIVKGDGIASKGNYVYVLMGNIGPISSNSGEIKFKLSDIKNMSEFIEGLKGAKAKDVQVPIMIENEFGISNYVTIEISYED